MADIVEILMLEHLAIRNISRCRKPEEATFYEFNAYLKNCHIEIEEKIVFPLILSYARDNAQASFPRIEQIRADHRLIETLADNLAKWKESGNMQLYEERLPLYFRLLVEHNRSEDEIVFPLWSSADHRDAKIGASEALNIIETFGKDRYLSITGLSGKAMDYLFGRG